MSDLKRHAIYAGQGRAKVELSLWQMPRPGKIPVLLLHGASANSATFRYPRAPTLDGESRSLADWLSKKGYEPWLLDWRGNGLIGAGVLDRFRAQLDFDHTAAYDIPLALETIQRETRSDQICAVGHCMGAATLAQAVAAGKIDERFKLEHVVLLAIGLFYEPAIGGRLRSLDKPLDGLWATRSTFVAVDPRPNDRWPNERWPEEIDAIYGNWPANLRPHPKPASAIDEMCNRVSFMFGTPYREMNLHPEVHDRDFLATQFGAIPLRMYVQGARNVNRGCAGAFDAKQDDYTLIDSQARQRFRGLRRVTLITGEKNEIWHRDSIDRMYEWLGRSNCEKRILGDYAHQDLLWGTNAYRDVFPKILEGLPR
jgi:cholesterol oxidase